MLVNKFLIIKVSIISVLYFLSDTDADKRWGYVVSPKELKNLQREQHKGHKNVREI